MRATSMLGASASFLLAGCASHLADNPFDGRPYNDLAWHDTYEDALEGGLASDRPVYLVLAAGPLSGFT